MKTEWPETVASTNKNTVSLSVEEWTLQVIAGPHQGMEYSLEQEMIRIGRAEWCDLSLHRDGSVSSQHCECWLTPKGVRLRDMNSRNGTLIQGCAIIDVYLVDQTVFQIGDSRLQLRTSQKQRRIPVHHSDQTGMLVGKSHKMREIFLMLSRLGKRDVNTLLTGETGTGKTSIARAIHQSSHRADGPFVVVNCGALPASLIEAELFGYEKGAFTGATEQRQGFFEQAHGGTLFLDEIGELPIELQPKLLDVLERRTIRRIGGKKEQVIDFRLLCATHRRLSSEIEQGRFRKDLYFRISVVELEIPPLRERTEDLSLLAQRLLSTISPTTTYQLSPDVIRLFKQYLWPGNIRQMRNVLERSITFLEGSEICTDDIYLPSVEEDDYPEQPFSQPNLTHRKKNELLPVLPDSLEEQSISLKEFIEDTEKSIIIRALEEGGNNVQRAADLLNITSAWLYNRIKKYRLRHRK